ncbi:hypothetical protein C3L33_09721, partial [Rhododendron williamsianum]
ELIKKYKQAKSNLVKLEKLGADLFHGADATTMKLMRKFDRIIFNFPHAGFYGKEDNILLIKLHRYVVHGFLRNARGMLRANGEIHINHKTTFPYKRWKLVELASQNCLALIECVDFKAEDYPGYNNKRGQGPGSDDTFRLGACSTYKFGFSAHTKKMPKVWELVSPNVFGSIQSPPVQILGHPGSQYMSQILPPSQTQQHQYMPQNMMPQQQLQQSFFSPDMNSPCMPCDICGKSNHSTNWCYYQPQSLQVFPPFSQSYQNFQWRQPISPWMNPFPYPSGVPMYQSQIPQSSRGPMIPSQQNAFSGSQASTSQPHFAGFTEAYTAPSFSQIPGMVSGSSSFHVPPSVAYNEGYASVSPQVAASSSQPWYFDSGATNHITHSIQNLAHPQPATVNDGIMVGNGSHLQASHTVSFLAESSVPVSASLTSPIPSPIPHSSSSDSSSVSSPSSSIPNVSTVVPE